jgi:hypothetical protein
VIWSMASCDPFDTHTGRMPNLYADPDAEVVALSPKTLMESDRYICEICNQGFQRDQNLQMHRRRHKVRVLMVVDHDEWILQDLLDIE